MVETSLLGVLEGLVVVGHDHGALENVFLAQRLEFTHNLRELLGGGGRVEQQLFHEIRRGNVVVNLL